MKQDNKVNEYEKLIKKDILGKSKENKYILRLFIAGMNSKSEYAIKNLRNILDENLKDQYELEVIDIKENPELAKEYQIVASPTLIKELPTPLRKFIGDMSKDDKLLLGLTVEHS